MLLALPSRIFTCTDYHRLASCTLANSILTGAASGTPGRKFSSVLWIESRPFDQNLGWDSSLMAVECDGGWVERHDAYMVMTDMT